MRKTRARKRKECFAGHHSLTLLESFNTAFHEIWSLSMSTSITHPFSLPAIPADDPPTRLHQRDSGPGPENGPNSGGARTRARPGLPAWFGTLDCGFLPFAEHLCIQPDRGRKGHVPEISGLLP